MSDRAKSPWRSRLKRGAAVASGVTLLGAGFIGYLHTDSGGDWLRGRVEKALNERVAGSARLGGLHFSLWQGVRLSHLSLRDPAGAEVVVIDEALVAPSLRQLVRRQPALDEVMAKGVRLRLVQLEGGKTNLAKMFERPPKVPSEPSEPSKPLAYFRIGRLSLTEGDVEVQRLDGSTVAVKGATVEGSLLAHPADRDLDASVSRLGASITLHRPDGQEVTIQGLTTGLDAHLQGGAGSVQLRPVAASLGLTTAEGKRIDPTPIGLAGLSLVLSKEQLTAAVQQLELLALAVGSVDAKVGLSNGEPTGAGQGTLGNVRLDRDRVNALLGKPLLASHIDLEASLDGSREQPGLDLKLKTDGGALRAVLKLDSTAIGKPKFSFTLDSEGLRVHRAIQIPDGAEVELGALHATAQGAGSSRENVAADLTLQLGASRLRGTDVKSVGAKARYEGGVVKIHTLLVELMGQSLEGRGTYTPATRDIDVRLEAKGDLNALGEGLRSAGRKAPPAALLRGLRLSEGVAVEAKGSLDSELTVTIPGSRLGVAGGGATVEGKARLRKGKPEASEPAMVLEEGGVALRLQGVRIGALAAMAGRPDPGVQGRIDGTIDLQKTAQTQGASYDLRVTVDRGGGQVLAHAKGRASRDALALDLDVSRGSGPSPELLHAQIRAPLVMAGRRPGLDPSRSLSVKLDIPSRPLASLSDLLPPDRLKGPLAGATVGAKLQLEGTARAPKGTLSLDASGPLAASLGGTQRAHVDVAFAPGAGEQLAVTTDLRAWLREGDDASLKARVTAQLPKSPLVGRPDNADWALEAELSPQSLAALLPGRARRGEVSATIKAHGNRSDVLGEVTADLKDIGPEKSPPLGAHLAFGLGESATKLRVQVRGDEQDLATFTGNVGLGGQALIAKIRDKQLKPLETSFDLDLDVPERALSALAPWVSALRDAPGKLKGKIAARGPLTSPSLKGQIGVSELPAADGTQSQVSLQLAGSPMQLAALIEARPATGEGVTVSAKLSPLVAVAARETGAPIPVDVGITAHGARLSSLAPPGTASRAVEGTLDSDLRARVDVALENGKPRPKKFNLQGALALRDGTVKIPNSTRVLRELGLQITGDGQKLQLAQLTARESDLEQPNRSLNATGVVTLQGAAIEEASFDLKAHKWLVFGGNFGPTDAPRASLDADVGVGLAFSPGNRTIKATVRSMELLAPDRFLRAHQQEVVSLGDVIEVTSASAIGKLPVPPPAEASKPPAAAPPASATAEVGKPAEGAPPGFSAYSAPPEGERATEIEIELPPGSHIKQLPLDLRLGGTVRVRIAGGQRSTEGKLAVSGGSIFIGGRHHEVAGGELRFDAENPGGYFDITFKRAPHPAALRDVATGNEGSVRIHLAGPYGKQKPSYEGLGVGSLFDTLAINNAGRTRYTAQPDMPASEAAQLPQYMQLRQITFMAVNLPHLLFLDRISVWADPYDDRNAYGRLARHEAESYSTDGSRRVRTVSRPPRSPGQSEAEISYDLLFQNTPRTVSGVGLKAGTRAGGGPGLFWEWSSED